MFATLQWIMVAPDGTETLLNEEIVCDGVMAGWVPRDRIIHPFGMRVKGPEHDAEWAERKRLLMEESCSPSCIVQS